MSEFQISEHVQPLPRNLVKRFRNWKATGYAENRALYRAHADQQSPEVMAISCCDSRVHITTLFGASPGEFFVHRNIAALVPPYEPGGGRLGTASAVEYAVKSLGVSHILILGHSNCGGVQGCIDMCSADGSVSGPDYQFVGKWLDILRPAYKRVADIPEPDALRTALEREAVLTSLANLLTFPFVSDAVQSGKLVLHGLWHDIGEGSVWAYDPQASRFIEL